MSEVRANNLTNANQTGGPTLSGITTFSSPHFFVPPQGTTAQRPQSAPVGSFRFNTDSYHLEYYRGDTIGWVEIEAEPSSDVLGGGTGSNTGLGHRGLFKNGQKAPSTGSYSDAIDFLTISTLGNSQDFGDVSTQRTGNPGLSSRTRAIIGSGYGPANQIEFVTMASQGDATDFGDDVGNSNAAAGLSNGTRGIFAGSTEVSPGNVIRYITIDTLGNAVDFGDLNYAASYAGGAASTTRGLIAGGGASDAEFTNIDSITIASLGNAIDFGDLNYTSTTGMGGGSNATRAIWWGGADTPGYSNVNTICFNTIATTGNSLDFGDVSTNTNSGSAMPDGTRCVMKLGSGSGGNSTTTNKIESIQFATTGNATDFGDSVLQTYSSSLGSMSTGHGGLG